MIVESIALGTSLVGCAVCWATVQKHKILAQIQKDKLDHDLEVLRPTPEPTPEPMPPEPPSPPQQALTILLERRQKLEDEISDLRDKATTLRVEYGRDIAERHRADALKALEDAREEQNELVIEEYELLKMMHVVRIATDDRDESEHEESERVRERVDETKGGNE